MITKDKKKKLLEVAKDNALAFNAKPTEENYNKMQNTLAELGNIGLEKIGLGKKERAEICEKRQKVQKDLNQKVQPCKEAKKKKKGVISVTQEVTRKTVEILQEA